MKKSFILGLLFSVFTVFTSLLISCEIGMGNAIDLEAPVLTITTPRTLSNVHQKVTLKGTCTDNEGVKSVTVTNKETKQVYGDAVILGDTWTMDLTLPEGEITLVCTANDANRNYSTKSIKTITLLVDETAPEGLSWYLDRGNSIQIPLEEKETLEAVDTGLSVNKDIPQNEEFKVYGRMYDAMSINTITFILTDELGNEITKTVTAESIPENKSIYTPEFLFTELDFTSVNPLLGTGKHYLKASYYSSDNHGNNSIRELPYVMWYPESDIPGIQQAQAKNDKLEVSIGSSIPLHFFDDDGLREVSFDLVSLEDPNFRTITAANVATFKDKFTNKIPILSNTRDIPEAISAPDTPGKLMLVAYAKDENGNENTRFIETAVVDAALPLLILEAPLENSVPDMKENSDSEFEVKGFSYDTNGSRSVKIAFIPDSEYLSSTDKLNRAKELFADSDITKAGVKTITEKGEIVQAFNFDLDKSGKKELDSKWVIERFSFTFDLLTDFVISEQANQAKVFVMCLEDTDGNKVYKQFRVNGDSEAPEIQVVDPAENMAVCDYSSKDLILKFKAVKNSGLGIEKSTYKIERKDDPEHFTYTLTSGSPKLVETVDGYIQLTIPKATVKVWAEGDVEQNIKSDTQPVFIFYASDVLGNAATLQRTVVLSPLPVLEAISSDNMSTTYKKGDLLTIQTKFSDTVKVTGTPRLKLKYSADDVTYVYANYKSGSGTDTLSFEFTVPEGAISEGLMCDGIDLNGGKIETGTAGTGSANFATIPTGKNLQNSKILKLDGVSPKLSSETPITYELLPAVAENADGKTYVKKDIEIVAILNCTEDIFVSGSPVLKLKAGANTASFNFQSIDGNKVKFSHKVSDLTAEGALSLVRASAFSTADLALITDQAGNQLAIETGTTSLNLVIDRTKPANAPSTNIPAGTYNETKILQLSNYETGATAEYSIDGGVSWNTYTTGVDLTSGSYKIYTRQTDKAGNVSDISALMNVVINDTFPEVNGLLISKADGKYKAGTQIDFKLYLSDKVKVPAGSATLSFVPYGKTTPVKTATVTASVTGTNTLVFTYVVKEGDDFQGVEISGITLGATIKDNYGNSASAATETAINNLITHSEDCKREGIVLDGSLPKITNKLPANAAVSTDENDSFKVVLTFDEKVYKESGTITLQRKGDWAIPLVLSSQEFLSIYNNSALAAADRENLIITNKGKGEISDGELLDTRTGISVGPYKKITHGIKASNGKYVPDADAKYVLDFNLGAYTGSTTLDRYGKNKTVTVADIRKVLAKTGYHQHKLDINSSLVSVVNNVVTINFADVIEDGQEWELLMDEGCLRDATGNSFAGLAEGDYSFWSNKVATPVVRVDRYTHGWGAKEPAQNGTLTEITGYTANDATTYATKSGSNIAPTGYVRVRIDCETPGATINYATHNAGVIDATTDKACSKSYHYLGADDANPILDSSNVDPMFTNGNANLNYTLTNIPDIDTSTLVLTTGGTEYQDIFTIGDGKYTSSRKDYVVAYATKDGLTKSENGREGAFKTTVYVYNNHSNRVNAQINIEGGTAKGGEPISSGFPLKDATGDKRYSKNAYYDTTTKHFAWVSYEIVTNWAFLQHRNNYSTNYPQSKYGQLMYLYNFSTWEND